MITAYDALFARLFDDYVDIILVGDSLNMSFNGKKDTLSLKMDDALYHVKAVLQGAKRAFVVADMPFGSYQDEKSALKNATKFIKAGADAVKFEGGLKAAPIVKKLVGEGINVMAHIGLMPQFVRKEGGYKIKGRSEADEARLIEEAKALERAGAFSAVVEGTLSPVAAKVAKSVQMPIIGIGAGADVDGQVLVWSDTLTVQIWYERRSKPMLAKLEKRPFRARSSSIKFSSFWANLVCTANLIILQTTANLSLRR